MIIVYQLKRVRLNIKNTVAITTTTKTAKYIIINLDKGKAGLETGMELTLAAIVVPGIEFIETEVLVSEFKLVTTLEDGTAVSGDFGKDKGGVVTAGVVV